VLPFMVNKVQQEQIFLHSKIVTVYSAMNTYEIIIIIIIQCTTAWGFR